MDTKQYVKLALMELGLTEGESRVYLAISENLGIEAAQLKMKTKYSYAGVYKIVNALLAKEFIYCDNHHPSKYFCAPLADLANKIFLQGRKFQRLSDRLKNLDKALKVPEFSEIHEDDSFMDFYLNIPYKIDDGFIWCVGSFGAVKDFLGFDTEKQFIKSRLKKRISCDALIFDDNKYSRKFGSTDKHEKRETKFFTVKNYPSEFTYLYGDNVVTFYRDYDDKVKILKTVSREMAKAKLLQYQMLWNSTAQ